MKALIVGSGDFYFPDNITEYTVIACDGGLDYCRENNISPDYILGDFDSVKPETLAFFSDKEKKQYPTKKDMTDLELGLHLAIDTGATDITITGAISANRFDHSICNIQLLLLCLEKEIVAKIVNKTNTIMLINNRKELTLVNNGAYVSLLPLTQKVEGITLTGFEYPLIDYTLEMGSSLCISNKILDKNGTISIKNGVLIVISAFD